MKKLIITLTLAAAVLTNVQAGWYTTDTVNGQSYQVYHYGNDNPYTEVTGPDGYHAEGFTYPNGDTDWTVQPGYHRVQIDGEGSDE